MKTLIPKILPLLIFFAFGSAQAQYSISGPTTTDLNDQEEYTVVNGGGLLGKNWLVFENQGTVVSGQQTSTAIIQFTEIGNVIVNFSAVTPGSFNSVFLSKTVNVTGTVVGDVTITSGPTTRCQGDGTSDYNASASNATGYTWSLDPSTAGWINGSGTVTWNASFASTATVTVEANGPNNSSSTASRNVVVSGIPSSPPLGPNNTTICTGETAELTLSGSALGIEYSLFKDNNSLVGTQTSTQFGQQLVWNVSSTDGYYVRARDPNNSCGYGSPTPTVFVTVQQGLGNPSLSGGPSLGKRCQGLGQDSFSVSGGLSGNSYNWSLGGTYGSSTISGAGTTATVNWGDNFGNGSTTIVSVVVTSQCGEQMTLTKNIVTNSGPTVQPFQEPGLVQLCTGDTTTLSMYSGASGIAYTLLRNGVSVLTINSTSPGQLMQWTVSQEGTYSIEAEDSNNNCGVTTGTDTVTIDLLQGLGNPTISGGPSSGERCQGSGQDSFSIVDGSSGNSYIWSLANAGTSTVDSSTGIVEWDPDFIGTATVRADATSECGTTVLLEKPITVLIPEAYLRELGSNIPDPMDPYVPVEFSFDENGGTGIAEIVLTGGCSANLEIVFENEAQRPEWISMDLTANNTITVIVDSFVSVNGSTRRSYGTRVFINGVHVGIVGAEQDGPSGPSDPSDPPTCGLSTIEVDGTDIGLGTDIEFGIPADTKTVKLVYDPLGCAGEITLKDYNDPNGTPEWDEWLSFDPPTGNGTFAFTTLDNYDGITRYAYVGIYNLQNEFLGLFRIYQNSCTEQEWYPDEDSDGGGNVFAEPRYGCDPPTDRSYGYVDNNWDLCPTIDGEEEDFGCPSGLSPENRNTITTLSYDLNETLKVGSKSYFDEIGKLEQTQAWDIRSDSIWASVTMYDTYGRAALQTLSAPVYEGSSFQYKEGFVKKTDNMDYSLPDFDGANGENPNPVGSNPETLGWYYSENNDREGYQDVTAYPFTKSIYSDLNPGKVLRAVGGNKINGEWPQAYTFSMKASRELAQVVAFGDSRYNDMEITKTVTRDLHGVENVVFTDSDGKLLAAARSGSEGTTSLSMSVAIPEQGFVDIHVPEGLTGFDVTSPASVEVFDLVTEQQLTGSTGNLPSGFYRVAVNDPAAYVPETISVSYFVNYYDYSLNEYDEADRLIASYQPLGATKAEKPLTTYSYNTLGQLIETDSPDEGWAKFQYRKDGQIRFSQNEKQQDPNEDGNFDDAEFSYTNYDTYGRPVESGVFKEGAITFANADNLLEDTLEDIAIDNDGLADAQCSEQTFTLYDRTDTANLHAALNAEGIPTAEYPTQRFVNGNVSKTYTVEAGSSATSWYSYDVYGRVEWVVQQIEGLGTKTIDYEYDPVTGQVLKVYYQKEVPAERFVHRYTYNTGDQLVTVETSTDDSTFTLHANYSYYETGAMKRTELAGGVQGIDYVYNLAGQLKSINHPALDAANDPHGDANDLFGMQLDYHADDYKRNVPSIAPQTYGTDQLNGNIKGVRWMNKAVPGMTNELMYTYQYDRNNWLLSADFDGDGSLGDGTETHIVSDAVVENGETLLLEATQSIRLIPDPNGGGGFHAKAGSDFHARIVAGSGGSQIMAGDYDVSNITYDANGNLLTLKRNKNTPPSGEPEGAAMDDLSYAYKPGTNQLRQVVDAVGDAADADDIGTQPDTQNYVYNKIGQLIENKAEDISYLYNASGLVTEVQRNNLPLVKFFYNDRNQRVRKDTYAGDGINVIKATHYVRDAAGSVMAIYVDDVLAEQPIYGNSRLGVAFNGNNNSKSYVYELTDHLGNVRATFSGSGATESASDYYPGGMAMPGRNIVGDYRYNYQGQELDPETGKVAFQLRLYDQRIMRWLSPDPYGQHASPYMSMGNNWISRVDPDGGMDCPDPPCSGEWYSNYTNQLDGVTVTAGNGSWTSEGTRYGYSGTFQMWQQEFNRSGSYLQELQNWEAEHGDTFRRLTAQWDREEQNRRTLEKLAFFSGAYGTIGQIVSPGSLPTARPFAFKGIYSKPTRITISRNLSADELANFRADGNKFSILDEGFGQKQFWMDDAGLNFWTKSKLAEPYTLKLSVPSSHNRFYRYLDGFDALDYGVKDIDILNQQFILKSVHKIK